MKDILQAIAIGVLGGLAFGVIFVALLLAISGASGLTP
jgi:hypothetical protein